MPEIYVILPERFMGDSCKCLGNVSGTCAEGGFLSGLRPAPKKKVVTRTSCPRLKSGHEDKGHEAREWGTQVAGVATALQVKNP